MKSMPCNYYNAGTCSHSKTHETRGVLYVCVQPAMQQASLLATQKLNVDPRIKTPKKRMNLGGHMSMTTQRQKTKVYYSSIVSKARQQSNIDKNLAIRYFNKQKAYQSISANKSYADALKYGRNTLAKVNNTLLSASRITKSDPVKQGVSTTIGRPSANRVNATTCFNKTYKQESPIHITLHNRFDVFNTVDTTDEVDMPSVCYKDAFCDENIGNVSLESVRTQLGEQSCPVLERTSKISSVEKKNETGCPDGVNKHTKLGKMATNNYTSDNSAVRDVSTDGHSRTHSVDSKEVFDRNYVLNSCDNVTHISGTRGAENDSNHLNSVVHKLQFGFLPSETLKLYTGDPVYYAQIPDIITTHLMVKESGLPMLYTSYIQLKR